jgi:hypothetical protein
MPDLYCALLVAGGLALALAYRALFLNTVAPLKE